MKYFIEVSYLGKEFHGWQLQENAKTIQGQIESALSTILGDKIGIHGSSRTDSGVHARQQFAHFETEIELGDRLGLIKRLNRFLDKDVSVKGIYLVSQTAHSRFDATGRKYIYRIVKRKDPFVKDFTALYTRDIDIEVMNRACGILLNHVDFQCFSKVKTDVFTYNCEIENAEWIQNNYILEFHISANRFLRGMVRAIVGTMLDIGYGKTSIEDFEKIILSKDRRQAGMAAKAEGLTLERVFYPKDYFEFHEY